MLFLPFVNVLVRVMVNGGGLGKHYSTGTVVVVVHTKSFLLDATHEPHSLDIHTQTDKEREKPLSFSTLCHFLQTNLHHPFSSLLYPALPFHSLLSL